MRGFFDTWWSVEVALQLLVPIVLLTHRLPRRRHWAPALVLSVGALMALAVVPLATGAVTGLDVTQAFLVFSLLLVFFVVAIHAVCDVGPWTAIFCATTGYTLQNLASGLIVLLQLGITGRATVPLAEPLASLVTFGVPVVVYTVGYFAFVRRIDKDGLLGSENRLMLLMLAAVIVVIIGLDLVIKDLTLSGARFHDIMLLRVLFALICVFVLFSEYELLYATHQREVRAETERLLAERERQYQLSRSNIEAINIKCHDIRHQISQLGETGAVVDPAVLRDIANEVNVYDSVIETGNEALDTILTEKGLACSSEGIVLSVIADGAALGFMKAADIYSLFGNALDNAIEAARGVSDPERRTISLSVSRRGRMVAVSVENYCAQMPRFEEGLPVTTKPDRANHGFGMRSMRATVTRYGGSLHCGEHDGVFYLNLLLASPEE